jgi:hypothetical protein
MRFGIWNLVFLAFWIGLGTAMDLPEKFKVETGPGKYYSIPQEVYTGSFYFENEFGTSSRGHFLKRNHQATFLFVKTPTLLFFTRFSLRFPKKVFLTMLH